MNETAIFNLEKLEQVVDTKSATLKSSGENKPLHLKFYNQNEGQPTKMRVNENYN